MVEKSRGEYASDYLICRSTFSKVDAYSVWRLDIDGDKLLVQVQAGNFDQKHQLIPIGNYVLEWGPIMFRDYTADGGIFPYRLFEFDPHIEDPLGVNAKRLDPSGKEKSTLVTRGIWPKKKFWWLVPDFGSPEGPAKEFMKGDKLLLVPLGTFVLFIIPTPGRGTFKLFHFDRGSADPLPPFPTDPPVFGSFETIQFGHELIPMGNYVLDWLPQKNRSDYWLWSFDSMNDTPLARPAIREGRWDDIDENHQLIPIGEHVLDWDMKEGRYRLWRFDRESEKLLTMVRSNSMPKEFNAKKTKNGIEGHILTGIQGLRPIDKARKEVPGTIDFMRTKIKHVVYYMIENRSFDHACGWLYEKGEDINFVGHDGPFKGVRHAQDEGRDYNVDPAADGCPKVHVSQDGPDVAKFDPYHDMTDTMRQYFFMRERPFDNRNGYVEGAQPDMGGFVWNNGAKEVMSTCKPEQLPVLNGLAKAFAVSDEWFCSMPGATDAQRAFALTGSALGELNNFMAGPEYINWPYASHRGSIWKVLWANGYTDWKIYNSVKWFEFVLTYHLFLKGQIPTVDAEASAYLAGNAPSSKYIGNMDQFKEDARNGTLPAFSFLEPIWIDPVRPATSYHPLGISGVAPGEKFLNEIYEALRAGPSWNETLLIITFDEHGGFFDHVPPPYTENPWPNDEKDGFKYDLMGVRVPCILVSPWIKEHTVFRSATPVAYDSTSILATLLHWYGIPKGRWGLGERTHHAPTFEGVFQCQSPRSDTPSIEPRTEEGPERLEDRNRRRLDDRHQHFIPRLCTAICGGKMSAYETRKIADDILLHSASLEELNAQITDLAERMRRR